MRSHGAARRQVEQVGGRAGTAEAARPPRDEQVRRAGSPEAGSVAAEEAVGLHRPAQEVLAVLAVLAG